MCPKSPEQTLARRKANRHRNPEIYRAQARRHDAKVKLTVLSYYSDNKLACVRCGFDVLRALQIDHINGYGSHHRKTLNIRGGTNFYKWLRRNDFPEGYQVLCANCQFIKKAENREYYAPKESD